jgi:hypothetical protein
MYKRNKVHNLSAQWSEGLLAMRIQGKLVLIEVPQSNLVDPAEIEAEDDDVKAERKRVLETTLDSDDYPLIMRNMRKVYAGRGGNGYTV